MAEVIEVIDDSEAVEVAPVSEAVEVADGLLDGGGLYDFVKQQNVTDGDDITTKLQTVLNGLADQDRGIYIRGGTYLISSPILLPFGAGGTIIGNGPSPSVITERHFGPTRIKWNGAPNETMFKVSISNFRMGHIGIEGDGTRNQDETVTGFNLFRRQTGIGTGKIQFDRVHFDNCKYGFRSGGSMPFTIATVTSQTEWVLTTDIGYIDNNQSGTLEAAVWVYDGSNNGERNSGVVRVLNYDAPTKTLTVDVEPSFTVVAGDTGLLNEVNNDKCTFTKCEWNDCWSAFSQQNSMALGYSFSDPIFRRCRYGWDILAGGNLSATGDILPVLDGAGNLNGYTDCELLYFRAQGDISNNAGQFVIGQGGTISCDAQALEKLRLINFESDGNTFLHKVRAVFANLHFKNDYDNEGANHNPAFVTRGSCKLTVIDPLSLQDHMFELHGQPSPRRNYNVHVVRPEYRTGSSELGAELIDTVDSTEQGYFRVTDGYTEGFLDPVADYDPGLLDFGP